MAPLILDGRGLARRRAPRLRDRASEIRKVRGSAPRLLLLAFEGPAGEAPWVSKKLRACEDVGIEVRTLILPADVETGDARTTFEDAVADVRADGVFVQFPFPPGVDGDALAASIPPEADIDLMSPRSFREFVGGREPRTPLTVAATLSLLEGHGIPLNGRTGLVVGDTTPFNWMLRAALDRRGVRTVIVSPRSPELDARLGESTLVVTSASEPGVLRSGDLPPNSVAIDGGYFNPGGQGDIDCSDGTDHLKALAPVPGGIGPMTVSALVEAVISRAEARVGLPR